MNSFLPSLQQSIRQNYDLCIESATPIGTGVMSRTMKLATNRGILFLKIYRSARNQETAPKFDSQRIAFTHAIQNFLHQSGFPIPRLLPNKSGETFSACDHQHYALSEFIEGDDYDVTNPEHLRASGEMLGLLHQRLRGFQPPIQAVWQPIEAEILTQLTGRLSRLRGVVGNDETPPASPSQIEQWLDEVKELIDQCQLSTANRQIVHGDYRAQNLKFDGGRIRAILDLDTARPANRLYDLAYALTFFPAVYQDVPLTVDQQSIFLQAYESICPLSETEREILPIHLRLAFLRGITLWLELYYFAGMSDRTRPWIGGYLRNFQLEISK